MTRALIVTMCITLIAGTALAGVPVTDQYLPALGHAFGAAVGGVQPWWRGDVWIFNPSSSQSASVTIYLLLRQANPNPDSRVVTVNPGDTVYLPDVILGTFGQNNLFAGLRFLSNIPVLVTGESYDANVTVVSKGQGTAGQFFAGLPASTALGAGDSTDLPGFDQDATGTTGTFRSNLAVVETTGNPVTYNVLIYNGTGALMGTKSYSLGIREVGQINTVITDVTGSTGTNQRVHIDVTGGTGRLVAVGSRIDNRTGDPSTVDQSGGNVFGRYEGTLIVGTGTSPIDGGILVIVGNGGVTDYEGVGGIPCGTDSFTVDFGPDPQHNPGPFAIGADGTFSTQVTIPYGPDSSTTWFTTTWTLSGARQPDRSWVGTLVSNTSGGTGDFAPCNVTGVTRNWRAAWTGSS